MKTEYAIIGFLLIILLTGCTSNGTAKTVENVTQTTKTAEGYSGALLAGNSAKLLDFVKADYEKELDSDKLIVLYFYANWCPICKKEFPLMQDAFNELQSENVVGFRVNYNDNETDESERELAREFGVAYQHTKVFVKSKERVLKSPESWGKERYLLEINGRVQ